MSLMLKFSTITAVKVAFAIFFHINLHNSFTLLLD